jgi:tRNA-specific 2-thiouridylase
MTLQLYDHGAAVHRKGACCAGQDVQDARTVADNLGIPHYVLNYEEKFRKSVIDPFAQSYIAGETPIPCVTCNQTVKFTDLLSTAKDLGADALATGHYIESRVANGQRALFRPADDDRDQSYFLFATTREQLDFLRFPLGGMSKPDVRRLAEEQGLIVAKKSDSQDICFVPSGKYSSIIARLNPDAARSGDLVHLDGTVLGQHDGIFRFTIGQRRGLGFAAGEPLHVVHIDAATNRVIVGPREAMATHSIVLRDVNWLGDGDLCDLPDEGLDLFVKVRSTHAPRAAHLRVVDGKVEVSLPTGESGISRGQACVFYQDDQPGTRVLGGGWIDTTLKGAETSAALAALLQPADERSPVEA